jgi:hypothetical protein
MKVLIREYLFSLEYTVPEDFPKVVSKFAIQPGCQVVPHWWLDQVDGQEVLVGFEKHPTWIYEQAKKQEEE